MTEASETRFCRYLLPLRSYERFDTKRLQQELSRYLLPLRRYESSYSICDFSDNVFVGVVDGRVAVVDDVITNQTRHKLCVYVNLFNSY